MQLTINIPNEQLSEKILWLLNSFKSDGLEILSSSEKIKSRVINQNTKEKKDSLGDFFQASPLMGLEIEREKEFYTPRIEF